MQDLGKSSQVKQLLEALSTTVKVYENAEHKIHFDYDSVIELLEQAELLITESARCPRPDNIPNDMPWCEKLYQADDDFDPFVFDGTMSVEDYERMYELMEKDYESESIER